MSMWLYSMSELNMIRRKRSSYMFTWTKTKHKGENHELKTICLNLDKLINHKWKINMSTGEKTSKCENKTICLDGKKNHVRESLVKYKR